ncbi:hypothetical protein [Anaerotignum lactatifermentans]|uniref:hypothetical protein n=1 Tax=Anaerotignum lactatifermentans TaxID=160404 RepID=UPI00307B3884
MGTLLVGAVLVAVIAAAVYKLRKDKKRRQRMQRQLRFLQFLRRTLPSLIKTKFAYTFSIKAGRTKVLPVLF